MTIILTIALLELPPLECETDSTNIRRTNSRRVELDRLFPSLDFEISTEALASAQRLDTIRVGQGVALVIEHLLTVAIYSTRKGIAWIGIG